MPLPFSTHHEVSASSAQILVQVTVFAPVAAYFLKSAYDSRSSLARIGLLVVAGAWLWTFVEYVVHRHLFHHGPHSALGVRLQYIYHGRHHEFPDDLDRLAMSPAVTIPLGMLFYLLFLSVLGRTDAGALFAGFSFGYLSYETVHYLVHAGTFARATPVRWLRRHHLRHHYGDVSGDFGVTGTIWDRLFGTLR
jgi:sterol desaturase/sphingolipid hydroxylase (fatty acid hydroxylase superfamily)